MKILAIDPGLSGALAVLDGDNLTVHDMPTHALTRNGKAKRELDLVELARIVDAVGHVDIAVVEQVGAMPGQGGSSMFAFGKAYGAALGVLAANFIPLRLVTPAVWKRAMGVPAAAGKDASRAMASRLLPQHAGLWTRVKDDGRAEAALLAVWCRKELA